MSKIEGWSISINIILLNQYGELLKMQMDCAFAKRILAVG